MKLRALLIGATLVAATAATALQVKGAMPDIAKQYYSRSNCHGAYDLIVEDARAGRPITNADREFVGAYENNAEAGKPCPAAPADVVERARNRILSTETGITNAGAYLTRQKDPAAYFEVGVAILNGKSAKIKDPKIAFDSLGAAAKGGDPSANHLLGSMAVLGTGTVDGKPDYKLGIPWLEAAAAAGHVDAQFVLGLLAYDGRTGKKDMVRAFNYFRQAAERGHAYAAYLAAYMANEGEGTRKDHALAYRLARNLVDQGEIVGAVLAPAALLQMKNAKENENEVLYYMDMAIKQGDGKIKEQMTALRPQIVAAYKKANAPPEYTPRRRKICPKKTVCYVDRFTSVQSCTTNTDYWNDCDTGLGN